jgi:hypothetical protein
LNSRRESKFGIVECSVIIASEAKTIHLLWKCPQMSRKWSNNVFCRWINTNISRSWRSHGNSGGYSSYAWFIGIDVEHSSE